MFPVAVPNICDPLYLLKLASHLTFSFHVQLTTMADPGVIALAAELTGQTRLSDADWNKVEATAQALANALRVKNSARLVLSVDSSPSHDGVPQMILRQRSESRNCPPSWHR